MKARIVYVNNEKREGYAIETLIDGDEDWGLETFYPLVKREGADEEEEKNFLHFSFVNKLKQLSDLGYSIKF